MKPALWAFAVVAFLSLVYAVVAGRGQDRWHRQVDSLVAVTSTLRAQNLALAAGADSTRASAERTASAANRRLRTADSTLAHRPRIVLTLPDSTTRDSLRYWHDSAGVAQGTAQAALVALGTYRVALDSLGAAFTAQQAATAALNRAYLGERDRADAAVALLRKAPGCHRLFGIPFPKVGPGAALTTRGLEPALAIIIPLGGC